MPDIRAASDRSLLITFESPDSDSGAEINVETAARVAALTHALEGLPGILNLHPAYVSVLVEFDLRLRRHAEVEALVREALERPVVAASAAAAGTRLVEIPVRYGGAFGPDLQEVARHAGISPQRVIEIHASASYLVHFLGFSPGFPYLGGLPRALATPRLASPRTLVPAGSVAIGGSHAGIYPMDSPGGWRIIGRTPARLFDPAGSPPALLAMGDRVRFVPIPEAPS